LREQIEATLQAKVRQMLEKQMNLNKPSMIEHAIMKSLTIGTQPPRISNVTASVPQQVRWSGSSKICVARTSFLTFSPS
jgi:hypothetical protein